MILPEVRIYSKLTVGTTVYEEDDLHKPYFTRTASRQGDFKSFAKDADRLYTFANVQPRKGKEFEEMELNIAWDEFAGCKLFSTPKLIAIKFPSLNTVGAYTFLYGWIDDAEPVATKGPQTNTRIKWHVDWWLTWADYNWFMLSGQPQILTNWFPRRVTIGAGRLLKGPSQFARPSSSAPRKWLVEKAESMFDDSNPLFGPDTLWAVMCATNTSGTPPDTIVTSIAYYFWPIGKKIDGAQHPSPNYSTIFTGRIEETMGIDPSRILGFWAAPFKPLMVGNIKNFDSVSVYEVDDFTAVGNAKTWILDQGVVQTDDKRKIIFTDPTGTEMYTAPWGIPFRSITGQIDIGTSIAALHVYLGETNEGNERKGAEGRLFSFPLPSLPVTENAWSSYTYSGQRDYDMEQKAIQRDRSAVNGIAGIGTQAIGGALAGTAAAPGAGTAIGTIAGLASGMIGTAVNYFTAGEFDNREQRNVDNLTSRQTAGMLINSGGRTSLRPIGTYWGWNMITMVRDPVSLAELEVEQKELGCDTDTYVVDCTNLISGGGPLRIEGLRVKGDIPKEGKEYIAGLFSRGVHIDLIE